MVFISIPNGELAIAIYSRGCELCLQGLFEEILAETKEYKPNSTAIEMKEHLLTLFAILLAQSAVV